MKISVLTIALALSFSALSARAAEYDPTSSPQSASMKACVSKMKKQMPVVGFWWQYSGYLASCERQGWAQK